MKIGVCCSPDFIGQVKAAGYDYWEVHLANLIRMDEESFETLRKRVEVLQFPAEASNCFFSGDVNLYADDLTSVAAYTETGMKRLAALGGKVAVVGSGGLRKIPEGEPRAVYEEKFAGVMRLCGEIARKYGIILALEPLNFSETNFINTVEEGLAFVRRIAHPNVKCLADFYHVFRVNEPIEHIAAAGDLLVHTHVAVGEDRHLPTVADEAICREWKQALNDCGYDGRISLEGSTKPDFETVITASYPVMKEIFRPAPPRIKITEYRVLGNLPDPFMMKNGTRISDPSQWEARRAEMYKDVIELQYGTQPPKPEILKVDLIQTGWNGRAKGVRNYRITTGKKDRPVSFYMKVFLPEGEGPFPAVVDGDLCWTYCFNDDWRDAFLEEGIALVMFNRTELANDIQHEGRRKGPLYDVYPEYTFGALGAWAWGFSRCVDALETLDFIDKDHIVFSGHSRGGKTAALAGALDERAFLVNPNETNAGACSCYRIHMKAIREDGAERPSETLADLYRNFDFWLGEGMEEYTQREQDLPFDCHMLKAMIAPRTLFISEAASDIWTNPVGTWMTTMAAKEVYQFLEAPDNLYWYFRDGYHKHDLQDVKMLVNLIKHKTEGRRLHTDFFRRPFEEKPLIFDWKCPEKE